MIDEMEGRGGRPRPDAMDVHVGARVRERRIRLGMSQEQLAESIGLSFQQIQKYERGVNRMGASRLFGLARALGVSLDFFFADGGNLPVRPLSVMGWAEPGQEPFGDAPDMPPMQPDARALLDAFARISDRVVRQRVVDLVKSLAPEPTPDD